MADALVQPGGPDATNARVGGAAGTAGAAILYVAAAVLICGVLMPPTMDFPNHLARIWLLAGAAGHAPMDRFYQVDWAQASTNVGVDYVAALLARALPILTVSKLLLLLIFLGPPLAAAVLMRRLFGRFDAWSLTVLLFAWTTTSVAGFMSYQIAIAGALLAAAAMVGPIGGRRLAILFPAHLALSAVLLVIHPFGLLFYLALFTGLALGPAPWPTSWRRVGEAAGLIAPAAVLSVLLVFLLFRLAPSPPGNLHHLFWLDFGPVIVFRTVVSAIFTYDKLIDLLFLAGLVAIVGWLAAGRRLRVHGGLLAVAVALALLSAVFPSAVGDASWLERRLPLMAALTVLVSLHPALRSPGEHRAVAAALFALALLRVCWVGSIWIQRDGDVRALIDAGRAIPSGSRVLLLRSPTLKKDMPAGRLVAGDPYSAEPTSRHLGALLVITRQVFVPTLFSIPGQHPLRVRPAWAKSSVTSSAVRSPLDLPHPPYVEPYLRRWRCRFDYVVVTDQDQVNRTPIDPRQATPIAVNPYVEIARVIRPVGCPRPS